MMLQNLLFKVLKTNFYSLFLFLFSYAVTLLADLGLAFYVARLIGFLYAFVIFGFLSLGGLALTLLLFRGLTKVAFSVTFAGPLPNKTMYSLTALLFFSPQLIFPGAVSLLLALFCLGITPLRHKIGQSLLRRSKVDLYSLYDYISMRNVGGKEMVDHGE